MDDIFQTIKKEVAKEVLSRLDHKNNAVDEDKWGDPNYLKTLSSNEINQNWDKVQKALKNKSKQR